MFDIVIKNAKLRKKEGLFNIGIKNGKIEKISQASLDKSEKEIDAFGKLVTESFINPHLHLCKVYTFMMMEEEALKDYHGAEMGKAMTAIELASLIKSKYDEKWIIPNVRKALNHAINYGVTHLRGFADVDSKAKLEGVKALLKVKEEFKGVVDLQVVAFPQDGIVREKGAYELVEESLKMGADLVGGIPWIEYTEEDEKTHIDKMFELAKKYDKGVSMLVDDAGDPTLKTLEMLTLKTIKEGFNGRVLAHHARAMQFYPTPYFMKLVNLLKKGEVGVVSDPHTGPLHARVREMIEEGALVVLGQDDISDAYYPYGRNNMLEVAFLVSHILWMTTKKDMEKLYDMITIDAGKAIGLKNHKLEEGNIANLVVLNEDNVLEALRYHREPKFVISNGKIINLENYKI